MRVSLFNQFGALNSPLVWQAIQKGLRECGIDCVSHDYKADVAVIWSLVWAGRMRQNQQVWQQFRNSGRKVLVVEVGLLKRGQTWKLGIDGTGTQAYYGLNFLDDRAEQLGIKLEPWQKSGTNILIACQRSDSEQWSGLPSTEQWLESTIKTLRQYTDRPIVVRPHPRQKLKTTSNIILQQPKLLIDTYDSFDFESALKNTWAVINHNSGPGSQAIIQGVPAFVDRTSLASPVANLDLANIENPVRPQRNQWLNKLAHTEWTIDEIASGYPLKRLLLP